jgi:hypothetical protein
MPAMHARGVFPALVLVLLLPSPARSAPPVTWADLQPALQGAFCSVDLPDQPPGSGRTFRVAGFGSVGCPEALRKTPLQRAVLRAFDDARAVLVSVRSEAADQAEQLPDLAQRTRAYAQALLTDELFTRALLVSLRPALKAAGISCSDCPAPGAPPPLAVPWQQFRTYVAAHVWPDPVEASAPFSYHTCAGINGISRIPNADPRLVRAAFVAAYDADLAGLAKPIFSKVTREPGLAAVASNDAKTEYLRRRMGEEVQSSPRIRKAVCKAVEQRRPILGVQVDCP